MTARKRLRARDPRRDDARDLSGELGDDAATQAREDQPRDPERRRPSDAPKHSSGEYLVQNPGHVDRVTLPPALRTSAPPAPSGGSSAADPRWMHPKRDARKLPQGTFQDREPDASEEQERPTVRPGETPGDAAEQEEDEEEAPKRRTKTLRGFEPPSAPKLPRR